MNKLFSNISFALLIFIILTFVLLFQQGYIELKTPKPKIDPHAGHNHGPGVSHDEEPVIDPHAGHNHGAGVTHDEEETKSSKELFQNLGLDFMGSSSRNNFVKTDTGYEKMKKRIDEMQCEHKVWIGECEPCRYEGGLVKLNPALFEKLLKKGKPVNMASSTSLILNGEIDWDPMRLVNITSFGNGKVIEIKKHLGDEVQEGEVLAIVHSNELAEARTDYLKALSSLKITEKEFDRQKLLHQGLKNLLEDLKQGRAPRSKHQNGGLLGDWRAKAGTAKARLDSAKALWNRENELMKKKLSTRENYEKAKQEYESSRFELDALSEQIMMDFQLDQIRVERDLQSARTELDSVTHKLCSFGHIHGETIEYEESKETFATFSIVSPRKGTIVLANLAQGEFITDSQVLYQVGDVEEVWGMFQVFTRDIYTVSQLLESSKTIPVQVWIDGYKKTYPGTADFLDTRIDPKIRSAKLRVRLKNTDKHFRPGMYVQARLNLSDSQNSIYLPEDAVAVDEGKYFIFQHYKDDLWVKRDVTPGRIRDGYVEIMETLNKDIEIILEGVFVLKSDVLREKMGAGCAH